MSSISSVVVSLFIVVALSACGSGSGNGSGSDISNLGALSCQGNRVWDFGESDEIQGAESYISETDGSEITTSRFPCAILWEYQPTVGCSLGFSYEEFIAQFELEDFVDTIGTSGANLVVVGNDVDSTSLTGTPANISITELFDVPDCEFN